MEKFDNSLAITAFPTRKPWKPWPVSVLKTGQVTCRASFPAADSSACVSRALINYPVLILADEPTGNLDEKNEKLVMNLFRELNEEGHTIITVTHSDHVGKAANGSLSSSMDICVKEEKKKKHRKNLKKYGAAGCSRPGGSDADRQLQ